MDDDGRAVFDGAAEVGAGGGVVDDQRDARPIGNAGDGVDVRQRPAGIADRLAEESAGVGVDGFLDLFRIIEVDEFRRPAELADRVGKK